jgi:hypothetical protein
MIKWLPCYTAKLFFCFLVFLFSFFWMREVEAINFSAGDLIKGSSPAVYYIGDDGKRYVFPSLATYKSWYSDFSAVKTVGDAELKNIVLGGVRFYKPGMRLLKMPSRSEVYEVSDYGVLRWLPSSATAVSRYGEEWQKLIDDLPEIFFSAYKIGATSESSDETPPAEVPAEGGEIGLTVSFSGEAVSGSYVKKSKGVPAAAFRFGVGDGSNITINSLTLTSYVDAVQGDPDFGRGVDADSGFTTSISDLVSLVYLYDQDGNFLAGPVSSAADGRTHFQNLNWTIAAGATAHLIVKVDFNPGAPYLNNDRFAFDIDWAGTDIQARDKDGKVITAEGDKPNGGTTPLTIITILQNGTLKVETDVSAPISAIVPMGQSNVEFNRLKFIGKDEPFLVTKLSLANKLPDYDRNIRKIWISYPKQDGTIETKTANLWFSKAIFYDLNFYVPREGAIFSVFADIKNSSEGATSGDRPSFTLAETDFEAHGQISEAVFGDISFGSRQIENKAKTAAEMLIRKTKLGVTLNPETPLGPAGRGFTNMMKFDVTVGADGPSKIKKLTFAIYSDDSDTAGTSNDLLEKLLEITSDYGNNIGHADLHFAENLDNALAEGYSGSISYGVYDASDRIIVNSPGFETDSGDYGILQFIFNYGSEISIAAGTVRTLILELNTSGLVYGTQFGPRKVWVKLLDDGSEENFSKNNFEWNDGDKDATGYLVGDLPLAGRALYIE